VLLDSLYARKEGWLSSDELARIVRGLRESGFTLWFDELDRRGPDGQREILSGLEDFREHLGGELTITYPQGIGARHEVHRVEMALMEQAMLDLRAATR